MTLQQPSARLNLIFFIFFVVFWGDSNKGNLWHWVEKKTNKQTNNKNKIKAKQTSHNEIFRNWTFANPTRTSLSPLPPPPPLPATTTDTKKAHSPYQMTTSLTNQTKAETRGIHCQKRCRQAIGFINSNRNSLLNKSLQEFREKLDDSFELFLWKNIRKINYFFF